MNEYEKRQKKLARVGFLILLIFTSFNYWLTHRPVDPSLPKEEQFIQSVKILLSDIYWLHFGKAPISNCLYKNKHD